MTKKLNLKLFVILLVVITGCTKENDLKQSVFIPDMEHEGLPVYSEWGYNTFGAYYDRLTFVSNSYTVPVKVIVTDTAASFNLSGRLTGYTHNNDATLSFRLTGINPSNYVDLTNLNGKIYDLKEVPVDFAEEDSIASLQIISGTLEFKRAQVLRVDFSTEEVILSGYFEFKAIVNGQPITVSDGRFDVGVGDHNFYLID